MDRIARLRKRKRRTLLVLSASSPDTGLLGLVLETRRDQWSVVGHALTAYPHNLRDFCVPLLSHARTSVDLDALASFDLHLSHFYLTCAQRLLASMPRPNRTPDVIVLNGLTLWKGALENAGAVNHWNISCGDGQLLADTLKAPVVAEMVRADILQGGAGFLSVHPGDLRLAAQLGPLALMVNIGIVAHMTLIDTRQGSFLVDVDAAPGTILINQVAQDCRAENGFDRDGAMAAGGSVDLTVLEELVNHPRCVLPWSQPLDPATLLDVLSTTSLKRLTSANKLATITALTARLLSRSFQHYYKGEQLPDTMWLSGGGSNNLALVEYLNATFAPLAIKNVEERGIPADGRIACSLGLTVNSWIDQGAMPAGRNGSIHPPGRLYFPACE